MRGVGCVGICVRSIIFRWFVEGGGQLACYRIISLRNSEELEACILLLLSQLNQTVVVVARS